MSRTSLSCLRCTEQMPSRCLLSTWTRLPTKRIPWRLAASRCACLPWWATATSPSPTCSSLRCTARASPSGTLWRRRGSGARWRPPSSAPCRRLWRLATTTCRSHSANHRILSSSSAAETWPPRRPLWRSPRARRWRRSSTRAGGVRRRCRWTAPPPRSPLLSSTRRRCLAIRRSLRWRWTGRCGSPPPQRKHRRAWTMPCAPGAFLGCAFPPRG
mmetsp:Transcript_48022/g.91787  ORF Transcript_48022/g.91787 Transcript_48022/m.91787 type:complete len:215 (-) Transcript_48022:477-1121(-)